MTGVGLGYSIPIISGGSRAGARHIDNVTYSIYSAGGLTTLVASYLARARGSNEPELSISRVKDLDKFIREADAYILDYGHLTGDDHDEKINSFRQEFEELLGNGSG